MSVSKKDALFHEKSLVLNIAENYLSIFQESKKGGSDIFGTRPEIGRNIGRPIGTGSSGAVSSEAVSPANVRQILSKQTETSELNRRIYDVNYC